MTYLEHMLRERAWLYSRLRELNQEIKDEQERAAVTQTHTQQVAVNFDSVTASRQDIAHALAKVMQRE